MTLSFIKDLLVAFAEYIQMNYKDEFIKRINVPKGMTPLEFLKTFNIPENSEIKKLDPTNGPIYHLVKYL